MCGKSNSKCCDKSREPLERESQLLGNASLDQAAVGGRLGGDGAPGAQVEVGNLLAEGGFEIGMTDVAHDSVTGVGQERIVHVGQDESADAKVDKIKTKPRLAADRGSCGLG